MYDEMFPEDPYYRSDRARYLMDAVHTLTGYEVVPDDELERKLMEIKHRAREVHVKTGQAFPRFHQLLGRCTLFVKGGSLWAPEFHERPRLTVVHEMSTQRIG